MSKKAQTTVMGVPSTSELGIAQPQGQQPQLVQQSQLDATQQKTVETIQQQEERIKTLEQQMQQAPMNTQPPQVMQTTTPAVVKMGTRWVKSERANVPIRIGVSTVICDVAATPQQQVSGLQAYDELPEGRGLWFPQAIRRVATYHMGQVSFPIDIVFVDNGKIAKITANIKPHTPGVWSSVCTDVIEVNGGWCKVNKVAEGDLVLTSCNKQAMSLPSRNITLATSEVERLMNTSWSGPQKARISDSDKDSSKSYDILRTLTEANADGDLEQELKQMFPHRFKEAQDNRLVKPNTYTQQPGEIDKRNPIERFKDHDLPNIADSAGEDNPDEVMGGSGNKGIAPKRFYQQFGFDPITFREENGPTFCQEDQPALRSGQKVTVDAPGKPVNELMGFDQQKLAGASVRLFEGSNLEWQQENEDGDKEGWEVAVVNDNLLSDWITKLGFDDKNTSKLQQVMFTSSYKTLLGNALIKAGQAVDFQILGSDLIMRR